MSVFVKTFKVIFFDSSFCLFLLVILSHCAPGNDLKKTDVAQEIISQEATPDATTKDRGGAKNEVFMDRSILVQNKNIVDRLVETDLTSEQARTIKQQKDFPEKFFCSPINKDDFSHYPIWSSKLGVFGEDQNQRPFYPLWSRGYVYLAQGVDLGVSRCYFYGNEHTVHSYEYMKAYVENAQGVLWLRTGHKKNQRNDLAVFSECCLDNLKEPIVLITTDGGISIPDELLPGVFDRIISHPMIKVWYAQNSSYINDIYPHEKLKPFPLGLDLHFSPVGLSTPIGSQPEFWEQTKLDLLIQSREKAWPIEKRPLRVLLDVRAYSHEDRRTAEKILKDLPYVDVRHDSRTYEETMALYASYPFVLSPRGFGLDTYRTWELIALGVIPIVRSKIFTKNFYDGLPVVVIDEFEELLDETKLTIWLEKYKNLISKDPRHFIALDRWLPEDLIYGRLPKLK